MKTANCVIVVFFVVNCLIQSSCRPEQVENNESTFELHVSYWNPDGSTPSFSFDINNTSPEIRLDLSDNFTGTVISDRAVEIQLNNIRIVDFNNRNYEIEEIEAFEFSNEVGDFRLDVESTMNFEQIEDLDVVMVLDASRSLGDDFELSQELAIEFAQQIFEENLDAEVGVISFSDDIRIQQPATSVGPVRGFVNSTRPGSFTRLYDAIDEGIDILQSRDSKAKALLTFTDGTDNNSDINLTPTSLVNRLVQDTNVIKISHFLIGLEGDGVVDKIILENLAVNNGIAEFPRNRQELSNVFKSFSGAVSNVYDFSYVRSNQLIPRNNSVQLKFVIKSKVK